MTLQKFSDKSFSSMFLNRLKSAVFFPIVGLFILGIIAVANPFADVVILSNDGWHAYDNISIDNVKFILLNSLRPVDGYFPDMAVIMYMAAIIPAILCGIMAFKDLSSKKTANVYYSLGFSRSKLFSATYLAGAASVIGMVVIPFALSFIINAFAFGISKELLSACIFVVSCLCNVSLIAYTISVIAMTLSGMLIEGVFFSFFLNAISPIFTFASGMFSDGLLTGGGFVEANDYYYSSFENSFTSAFLGRLSFMNNLSHSANEVQRLGCCLYTSDVEGLEGFLSAENWTTPKFIPLVVWSVILAGLVFLALCLFNRKKAENIGFFASSPVLYRIFFGTLIVGFSSLGCVQGRNITKGLTWLYVLIILAICLVITTILTLILTKLSRMKFKKEVKVFGIYSLAVVLFAFIFSTGFFGYTNRIPAVEKVAKVEITKFTSSAYDYHVNSSELYGSDYYESTDPICMGTFSTDNNYTFTEKADITVIQELHKGLISADNSKIAQNYKETKIGGKINVIYTLKNGKTISRSYYRITPELIDKYVNCKGVSEEIKKSYIDELGNMVSLALEKHSDYDKFDFDGQKYYTVFSRDFVSAHNVELSEDDLYKLLSAYTMDVENLTTKELLKPSKNALGALAIRSDSNIYGAYNEQTGESEVIGKSSELEYKSFNPSNSNVYEGNGYVVINENMTNTIKWAKEVGIYKYFAIDYDTEVLNVIEVTHTNSSAFKLAIANNLTFNLLFNAKSYCDNDSYSQSYFDGNFARLMGSHYVSALTDDEIKHLRENAHPSYLTTETGYFVRFSTVENPSLHATVFIPDSKLTPELKIKLAYNNDSAVEEEYITQIGIEHTTQIALID